MFNLGHEDSENLKELIYQVDSKFNTTSDSFGEVFIMIATLHNKLNLLPNDSEIDKSLKIKIFQLYNKGRRVLVQGSSTYYHELVKQNVTAGLDIFRKELIPLNIKYTPSNLLSVISGLLTLSSNEKAMIDHLVNKMNFITTELSINCMSKKRWWWFTANRVENTQTLDSLFEMDQIVNFVYMYTKHQILANSTKTKYKSLDSLFIYGIQLTANNLMRNTYDSELTDKIFKIIQVPGIERMLKDNLILNEEEGQNLIDKIKAYLAHTPEEEIKYDEFDMSKLNLLSILS